MRVAVLTSLYPSAVRPVEGIFAERRWSRMRARGHEVRVVQPLPRAPLRAVCSLLGRSDWEELARMPAQEEREGVPIERPRYLHLPGRGRANARAFARAGLRRALPAQPEVVVADYAWPAAAAAQELRAAGVPCVVSGRGSDVLLVRQTPELAGELARGLRAAGHWCAVSLDLVRAMDELGEAPGRGVLVPNGVDLELFGLADRADARAELGLDASAALVLCVGHLIERKDPLLALEVFSRSEAAANARLVFIGSGPLRGALAERIEALGLGDRVRLVGSLEPARLARWYAACDALLLTSTREGRPNVVLEALACGRAVLATAAGGTGELLEGLHGCLSEGRDPGGLAAMLDGLLAAPPAPEKLRGRVEPLSWEASLDALEGCLQAAVHAARGAA